jgi:hypothetical protein
VCACPAYVGSQRERVSEGGRERKKEREREERERKRGEGGRERERERERERGSGGREGGRENLLVEALSLCGHREHVHSLSALVGLELIELLLRDFDRVARVTDEVFSLQYA